MSMLHPELTPWTQTLDYINKDWYINLLNELLEDNIQILEMHKEQQKQSKLSIKETKNQIKKLKKQIKKLKKQTNNNQQPIQTPSPKFENTPPSPIEFQILLIKTHNPSNTKN